MDKLELFECRNCGSKIARAIDQYETNSICLKCKLVQELNIRYVGKKMTDVYQLVLDELEGYTGIVLNSDDKGCLLPIEAKNIVSRLKENEDVSKT